MIAVKYMNPRRIGMYVISVVTAHIRAVYVDAAQQIRELLVRFVATLTFGSATVVRG